MRLSLSQRVASRFTPLVLLLALAGRAPADWVETAFPERSFDFGTVARGSKVRHAFAVVNTTDQTIVIDSWTAKCGCTDVRVGAREVPPGTRTVVEMTLDTTRFEGKKDSGVTLNLTKPEVRQVELVVQSNIRADFTVTPGYVEFGPVLRNTKPRATLTLNYHGRNPDFQVTELKTISAALTAELKTLGRTTTGALQYQLSAELSPEALRDGRFKDEITLVTTDPAMPRIPISVSARVQSTVSASPTVMDLKNVPAGGHKDWTVLVRSPKAFRVLETRIVEGAAEAPPPSAEPKTLHPLKFRFEAPTEPGPVHVVIELTTDVANEPPLRLTAFANVVAAPAPAAAPAPDPAPAPAGSD